MGVVSVVVSRWVEPDVAGGVAALENLVDSSSKRVIRRFSSASGERDLAQGRCSEVTCRSVIKKKINYHSHHNSYNVRQ